MSDRRYSTSAWQKTRKAILRRDGGVCQVRGPRCIGIASSVHHIIPSSERPDLFFASENLVSACSKCNYGGGAAIGHQRRRETLEQLHETVLQQAWLIQQLEERIAELEQPALPPKKRPEPAIH